MNDNIKNRVALVTGATGGLGTAIAKKLSEKGCILLLTGKTREKLKTLCRSLETQTEAIECDLSDELQIKKLIRGAIERYGKIDILINNAGVFPVNPLYETTTEEFDKCIEINVRAPFILCRELLPIMETNGWGRIINIGSSSAFAGFKNTSAYCASKHALLGLSRSLHDEFKQKCIKVISVNPGSIQTEMGRDVTGQDFETFLKPEDIADLIAYHLSICSNMIAEEIRLNRMIIK
jgi:3-oxoacyl-[acyl-carrier protein] reductase